MVRTNVFQLLTKAFNTKVFQSEHAAEIQQLNKLYATLCKINEVIIKTKERDTLFQKICEASVDCGQFQMAWIGLIQDNDIVHPVAKASSGLDYLENIHIIDFDVKSGKGPIGKAIYESRSVFCQDIAMDPWMGPWRKEALAREFHASASIPIRQNSQIIGVFNVYADEPMFFDENQKTLMEEIGIDISFALDIIKKEEEQKQAKITISQSEINFQNIFENSPVGKSMTYLDGSMHVNRAFCEMLGYSEEELKITSWRDITHPDDIEKSNHAVQSLLDNIITQARLEKRFIHKNGNIVWVDLLTYLQRDNHNKPTFFITHMVDITQRKEAEQTIKEKNEELNRTIRKVSDLEKRWQFALSSNQMGAWELDLIDRKIIRTSGHDKIFGYDYLLPDWTYEMFLEHVIEHDRKEIDKQFKSAIENRTDLNFQCRIKRTDNQVRWIWICGQHHPDDKGNIYRMVGVIQDITDRKKHEQELIKAKEKAEANEEQFRVLLENAPEPIFIQIDRKFAYLNKAALNLYGAKSENELLDTDVIDRIHPEFKEVAEDRVKRMNILGLPVKNIDYKQLTLNGSAIDVEVSAVPINFNGEDGALVFLNDITIRKKTELLLQEKNNEIESQNEEYRQINEELVRTKERAEESEKEFRLLAESMPQIVWITRPDGWNIYFNHQWVDYTGLTLEESYGHGWNKPFHPDDQQRAWDAWQEAVSNNGTYSLECQLRKYDGTYRWWLIRGIPIFDQNGEITKWFGTCTDIHQIKQAEIELIKAKEKTEKSEDKFRKAFFTNPEAITITNLDKGTYISVNYGFIKMLEYTEQEIIGKSSPELKIWKNQNDRRNFVRLLKENNIVENLEIELRTKSGNIINCLVSASIIELDNSPYVISITRDITYRKKIEKELIQAKEKAEESDRLKTAFLQNMSHEIRTPMNAIMGFSDLMKSNFENKIKLEFFSDIISQRCRDLLDIVNDMLDIARIESGQLPVNYEECNINEMFEELTSFFNEYQERIGKPHILFHFEDTCQLSNFTIVCDKVKLKQIFINLVTNAFKFTEEGSIEIGCKLEPGQQLMFYVKDTGIGIPADKQSLIFERFTQLNQTPKKNIGGTGLGLAIVNGLLDLLEGTISIQSEPDKGSTFSFTIPYKSIQHVTQIPIKTKTTIVEDLSHKTILVVEDDVFNAEYIKEVLVDTGAKILLAETGKDAVEVSLAESVDLVLMDVRLPDINGYEATRQIQEHKPNLKIVAQTAYASPDEEQKALNSGCTDYISKPTTKETLLLMVHKHLTVI